MEGAEGGDGRARLVSELGRVQELVRQLELQLHGPATSIDLCRRLAHQIVALTDRSIAMVHHADATAAHLAGTPTPPHSGAPSPLSDGGGGGSDDLQQAGFRGSPKKRKATARWSSRQVRVGEGPADDGHCWRKYGQKDILGAKHPRAYYRCTHRNSRNCPATKQVQRADDDPNLFDVVYHGHHTCSGAGAGGAAMRPQHQPQTRHNPQAQSLLQDLGARLTVATTDGGVTAGVPPLTPESCPPARGAASPVGSDSNGYLGVSQAAVNGYGEWLSSDGGELQEVMSAFAAVHTPALDTGFLAMPEYFGYDASFDIDGAMPSLFFP